ncbi:hypothetical protein BCR42DRAFT_426381 [Absidia repens]|uniref:PROP1-like PPR domain-containing protein n=1 Tax=Absidia repens TaxID=90262 RepID=A0A1X2I148_9FUNG|nr:hypothetical protein BCR42DRAFT_426381 [Absidia repens]
MIPWRRLSLILSTTWQSKPLHLVPRQSPFFPSRSLTTTTTTRLASFQHHHQHRPHEAKIKRRPASKPPVSTQELAVQQSIASRNLNQAKKQLAAMHGTTLDRFHTWRPLLLLARKGRQSRDLAWLQDMVEHQGMKRHWGLTPDLFDVHALMFCYGVHGDVGGAERAMDQVLPALGLTPTVFTINTLLGCYQRNKAIDKALQVLHEQQEGLLDVASYNTVLSMLNVDQQWDKATQLYHNNMPVTPDRYTFSTMLHIATQTKNATLGLPIYQQLHTLLLQNNDHDDEKQQQQPKKKRKLKSTTTTTTTTMDIATVNAMMAFQVSVMKDVDAALAIYQHLCQHRRHHHRGQFTPDTITCNILLDGLLNQQRNPGKTAALVHQMETRGHLVPDHVTYGIMMEAEVMMGDLPGALTLFEEALTHQSSTTTTATMGNSNHTMERMMACLAKAAATLDHDHTTMERLWTRLATTAKHGVSLDVKAYNGLMHGLAKQGRADLAQTLYDRVFRSHRVCVADVATFSSLMLAYINSGQVDDAMEIYYVLREQHYKQQETRFEQQQQQQRRGRRPVIALDSMFYTTLISALSQQQQHHTNHHLLDSAMELFTDMRQLRIQPTFHTYTAMLHWCGQSGDLAALEEVHRLIKMDMALDPDVGIYNALMDGYNRTDQIDQVLYLWDTMLTTTSATRGVGIDETTISIVLDACGHHGQSRRAKAIWSMLLHRNDITLNTNNYNSYVECLCRVGAVSEEARWRQALEVVTSMVPHGPSHRKVGAAAVPLPNSKTYNTLASFARKYGLDRHHDIVEQLDTLKLELQKRSLLD